MPCVLLALDVGSMHGDDDNGIEKLQAKKKSQRNVGGADVDGRKFCMPNDIF